jgi:hypothetical protein
MQLSPDGKELLKVTNEGIEDGKFKFPDTVTSIGFQAFYGCRGLTRVTIPKSVEHLNDAVFYGCTSLTHVIIPKSVKI